MDWSGKNVKMKRNLGQPRLVAGALRYFGQVCHPSREWAQRGQPRV